MSKEKIVILYDDESWDHLLPFTFTRPVSEIRTGILTIKEKWHRYTGLPISYLTREYLQQKYPHKTAGENIYINSTVLPNKELVAEIMLLKKDEYLATEKMIIAFHSGDKIMVKERTVPAGFNRVESKAEVLCIRNTWDIFVHNEHEINADFDLITAGRKSARLSETNNILSPGNVFVEDGVKAEYATINATAGKVYIGRDAEIMEGSVIRGPAAIGDHSTVKLIAKVYGNTSVGPHCKVGGEIYSTVIFGYSNKAHDGYLGNSIIGEWCNIGADSNNSNLKNNYAKVKLWDYAEEKFVNTGMQFCGLIMGDHSKCGINTMFNTGTVVGVSTNLFGAGFPRNFVPSFSWGGTAGYSIYNYNKAIDTAEIVYKRRKLKFTEDDKAILKKVFEMTEKYRKF